MKKLFHLENETPELRGATPALARQLNIRRVLDLLRRNPPLTRAEVTRQSGISAPTMSKLLDILSQVGLIREVKAAPGGGRGRPSRCYTLSGRRIQVFGAVIGVKSCRIFSAPLALELRKTAERVFATPYSYQEMLLQFRSFIEEQTAAGKVEYLGLGLCTPGLINRQEQRITISPNIRYLDGTTPAPDIAAGFNLKTVTIHEEHALALAEQSAGHTAELSDFALVDISEGMGMAIFANGEHVAGKHGFAGEIGHICAVPGGRLCGCGRKGCFETVAADRVLLQAAAEHLGRPVSFAELAPLLRQGDPVLSAAATEVVLHLGRALSMTVNFLNPGLLLLHSRMLTELPELFEQVKRQMCDHAMTPSAADCELRLTGVERDSGVLAAVSDALLASIVC